MPPGRSSEGDGQQSSDGRSVTAKAFALDGQVAIVTGGGTGIGRATAMLLAEHGATVMVASRRVENLVETCRQIEDQGGSATYCTADLRVPSDCEDLVTRTVDDLGRIDILVNNAGGSRTFAFNDWSLSDYQKTMDLNLRSVFLLSQAVTRHMVSVNEAGNIVNVSSLASSFAIPKLGPYGLAKAAVNQLTRVMAAEFGPYGIRVNCVSCGYVKTQGFVRSLQIGPDTARDPDAIAGQSNALGRAGTPEEIAYPILFLASSASSYLTGETVFVGGGPPISGPW